jgi:KipI family sensor histidine kinase inhibitor
VQEISWRAAGEDAILLELPDLAAAHRVWSTLRRAALPGVLDLVVGARTVLVVGEPAADLARVREIASGAEAGPAAESRLVEIPVEYDGADLADVAARTRLSTVDIIRIHSDTSYVVAFLGFAPGFPYMTGLDPALQLPRRDIPRTRVPAGSVAIAGEYTAVYPSASPGGWHLLGHTDIRLFADDALLGPGDRVRFVPR